MKHINELRTMTVLFTAILVGCVQETHTKTVVFKVDMNDVENVGNVGIRGQFTNPPWELTVPMTDENNDGIYETTVSDKTAQNSVEFKFVNQNDQFELKDKNNRTIPLEYKPETITYEAVFDNQEGRQTNN